MIIRPWDDIVSTIQSRVRDRSAKRMTNEETSATDLESLNTEIIMDKQNRGNLTMSYGCQLVRTLHHNRGGIKSALYLTSSNTELDNFLSMDTHHINTWKGDILAKKHINRSTRDDKGIEELGISLWVYASSLKLILAATKRLEINVLNTSLTSLLIIPVKLPILSMHFMEDANELLIGGIGTVTAFKLSKNPSGTLGCQRRLFIECSSNDIWINHIACSKKKNRIYVCFENHLNIYDFETGKILFELKEIHDESITSLLVVESQEVFVTGSKNGSIRVWNHQNYLLAKLKGHSDSICGLSLVQGAGDSPIALIASLSNEGTLQMWNMDSLKCTYRADVGPDCRGLIWMKSGYFATFSSTVLYVWNQHQFFQVLTQVSSPIVLLSRIEFEGHPPRLFALGEDGSFELISPRTGEKIVSGFPPIKNTVALHGIYDYFSEKVYILFDTGDVMVHSCTTNPCVLVDQWINAPRQEKMTCICEIKSDYPDRQYKPASSNLHVISGTAAGELLYFDIHSRGKRNLLVQAHVSSVVKLEYYQNENLLFSSGKDFAVKIWKPEVSHRTTMKAGKGPIQNSSQDPTTPFSLEALFTIRFQTCQSFDFSFLGSASKMLLCRNKHLQFFQIFTDNGSFQVTEISHHFTDDDHDDRINSIARLDSLNLFLTSSDDGYVKVWNGHTKNLLREMKFEDTVHSVQFANGRGDIIVGMGHQIAIVQFQDYLPDEYLVHMMEKSWIDDPVESPIRFDETLSLWRLSEDIEPGPVSTDSELLPADIPSNQSENDDRQYLKQMSGSAHAFILIEEESTFEKEKEYCKFEDRLARLEQATINQKGQIDRKSKFEAKRLLDDLSTTYRLPEMHLEALMEQVHFPLEFMPPHKDQQQNMQETPPQQEANQDFQPNIMLPLNKLDLQASFRKSLILERPKEVLLPREKVIEVLERARERKRKGNQHQNPSKKEYLIDRVAKFGITPNSVLVSDISKRQQQLRREQLTSLGLLDEDASSVDGEAETSTGAFTYDSETLFRADYRKNHDPKPIEDKRVSSLFSIDENTSTESLREVSRSDVLDEHKSLHHSITQDGSDQSVIPKPHHESKKKQPKSKKQSVNGAVAPKKRIGRKAKIVSIHGPIVQQNQDTPEDAQKEQELAFAKDDHNATEERDLYLKSRLEPVVTKSGDAFSSQAISQKHNVKDPTTRRDHSSKLTDHLLPPETSTEEQKQAYGGHRCEQEHSGHEPDEDQSRNTGNEANSRKRESPKFSSKTASLSSFHTQSSDSISNGYYRTPSSTDTTIASTRSSKMSSPKAGDRPWTPLHLTYMLKDVQKILFVDIFRSKDDASHKSKQDNLEDLARIGWFPSLASGEVSLDGVISNLLEVLKMGIWREKVEAAKVLLYVYHTFRQDILDPLNQIILPQLEHLQDEDWQVRAQMAYNLAAYDTFSDDVIYALVLALADSNMKVVEAAKESLGKFGITSKSTLYSTMIRYKMIQPPDRNVQKPTFEVKRQSENMGNKNDVIRKWLVDIDSRTYGRNISRPDSCVATLNCATTFKTSAKGIRLARVKPHRLLPLQYPPPHDQ